MLFIYLFKKFTFLSFIKNWKEDVSKFPIPISIFHSLPLFYLANRKIYKQRITYTYRTIRKKEKEKEFRKLGEKFSTPV